MDHFSIIRFPYTLHLNRLHFLNMHKLQRIFLWSYKYLSTLFTIIKYFLYLNDVFFTNTLGGVSGKYQVWGHEVGGQSFFFCQLYYPQQTERWALHRGRWFHQQQQKAFFELVFLGYANLFFCHTIDMGKVGPQGDATMKVISMLLHFFLSLFSLCHSWKTPIGR